MRSRTPLPVRASVVAIILWATGCTAILGDFEVGGADGQPCEKTCGGQCVSKEDPTVGCAAGSCDPCPARPNAASSCTGGACSFTCNENFADCDANPENGCEKSVASDPANCGGCNTVCGTTNTAFPPTCNAGKCEFTCNTGFAHCGTVAQAGCETDLMTNPDHCGACGHSCLGGACEGGKCKPFQLASIGNADGLAIDATHVYFGTNAPLIGRVKRDGTCDPPMPCPQAFAGTAVGDPLTQIRGPTAIVSDGTFVWWMNQANQNLGRRAVAPPLAPILNFGNATSNDVGYLVLAGGKLFWTRGFDNGAGVAPHVYRSNPDGTDIEVVANYPSPANQFDGYGGITADATHVYWGAEHSGIYRAAFGAATCNEGFVGSDLCQNLSGGSPFGIAVDDNFVYWTEPGPNGVANAGSVKRAPKTGGASATIATGQDNPRAIAVMDGYVYWANRGVAFPPAGSIRRAPQVAAPCAGDECELVAPVEAAGALVVGSDGLYWTNGIAAGGVYRLAR